MGQRREERQGGDFAEGEETVHCAVRLVLSQVVMPVGGAGAAVGERRTQSDRAGDLFGAAEQAQDSVSRPCSSRWLRLGVRLIDPRVQRPPRPKRIWTMERMHAFAAAAGGVRDADRDEPTALERWRAVYAEPMICVSSAASRSPFVSSNQVAMAAGTSGHRGGCMPSGKGSMSCSRKEPGVSRSLAWGCGAASHARSSATAALA